MKALFLTNPKDVYAEIEGGVQLCSKDFLELLIECGFQITEFHVHVSKNLQHRLLRKLRVDAYKLYDEKDRLDELLNVIRKENVKVVYINKSELLRYAKPIKKKFKEEVRVVVFSHGNETGDYLHYLTRIESNPLSKFRNIFRLGFNLYLESFYRIHYLDNVFVLSEQEQKIEQWLGINNPLIIYQFTKPDFINWDPAKNFIGFVGSLDHVPNVLGLKSFIEEIRTIGLRDVEVRLVGGPQRAGEKLANEFSEINYLGRLTEDALKEEAKCWSIFLNPVFYYSRGASTKLARGLSYGLPVISTIEGNRGYLIESNEFLSCVDAKEMAYAAQKLLANRSTLKEHKKYIEDLSRKLHKKDILLSEIKKDVLLKNKV